MAEQPKQFWENDEERKKFEEANKALAGAAHAGTPGAAQPKQDRVPSGPADGKELAAPVVVAPQTSPSAAAPRRNPEVKVGPDGALLPETMDGQWRLACALANPGVLGPAYEGKPGAVLMAMNLAIERGKGPFSFLHSSYEVKGKITEWGADALGAVYASGKVKSLEFFFMSKEGKRIDELDILTPAWAAVAVGERSDMPVRVIRYFTEDDARKANLLGNPKKETWAQYTRRMLETKAIGHMLKVAFPDVIAGLDMPEYDEHAKSDPGATSQASAPSTARERLLNGNRSEDQGTVQGSGMSGVRTEAGGLGARPDVEGDTEQPSGKHSPSLPGTSHGAASGMVQVPAKAPSRAQKARSKRMEDISGSVQA